MATQKDMKKVSISLREDTIQINSKLNKAASFKIPKKNIFKIIDIRKIKIIHKIKFLMKKAIMKAKD
jgi:hypothetical protein